jgi:SNF2 family DNA or RNA helicase
VPHADYTPAEPGVESRITVRTIWNEKELIRAVPGASWDNDAKIWTVPATWASLVVLRGVFGQALTLSDSVVQLAWDIRRRYVDTGLYLRDRVDSEPAYDHQIPLVPGLYPFQRAGVQFMTVADWGLLGDEMGTGKTVQALALLHTLYTLRGDSLPALVICPNSVKHQWAAATRRWLEFATPYVVEGSAAQRRKVLAEAKTDPHAVIIVNIESVRLFSRLAPYGSVKLRRCRLCDPRHGDAELKPSRCDVHPKEFDFYDFGAVILDEAHRIKEPSAQQTRAIWHVMHKSTVRYRWALTGTPIANHPGDLWSILHALAPSEFPTRGKFLDRYCLFGWNSVGTTEIVGVHPERRDELFRIIDPHFRRMLKAIVLPQLPPKIRSTRYADMTTAQARMYRELGAKLITRTPSGELLLAPTKLAATTRLMQLAASSVRVTQHNPDDASTWEVALVEPSPKLDVLEEVLDELGVTSRHFDGAPVIVAAEHKQLISLAVKRLEKRGVRYGLITGDISPYDRQKALDALRAREIRVLLFTGKAGGTGVDMSAADTLINLQRSWSLVDESQKEDRNHRIGSERFDQIRVIDIVTRDTVEEEQIKRLYVKLQRLDEITRDRAALLRHNPAASTAELDAEEQLLVNSYLGVPDTVDLDSIN